MNAGLHFRGVDRIPFRQRNSRFLECGLILAGGTVLGCVAGALTGRKKLRQVGERVRAAEALRESEERFKKAFAASPASLVISRLADGMMLEVNETFAKMLGCTKDGVVGRLSEEVGVFGPGVRETLIEALHWEGRISQRELQLNTKDGHVCWVLASAERIELGGEECIIWTGTDITDRKRAEELLRRSEARLAQAVRVGRLGTFDHDHVNDYIEASPEMREIYGFPRVGPIRMEQVWESVFPEDRERVFAAIKWAHDPESDGMYDIQHRIVVGGEVRWVCARAQSFWEGHGKERRLVRTIGAVRDITKEQEFQARLERLVDERTKKLQEMISELEHFSYTITHDMRAPLRGMRGYAELMTEACSGCRENDPRRFLEQIKTSAARMDALITDALNYSKLVRQELTISPIDPGALLRGMIDTYPELQPTRATIELRGDLPLVLANEAGLTQCFSNLLTNAVKFVKPGQKPHVVIHAEKRVGKAEDFQGQPLRRLDAPTLSPAPVPEHHGKVTWVRIWVEDNGIGISKAMLARVFDMFSRGQASYEGTGIGLALVRKVVERMGGMVGVESIEGVGSRFWVELLEA